MANRIVRLPENTIRLIAAGEVITSPTNVIKELLENSLDAKASNVRIIIEQGGLKSIEIIDNGHGIARADAELLCHRHATSKLITSDDLNRITTFGFRGEALASVSEVGELKVKTFNMYTDKLGWTATYRHGKIIGDQPVDVFVGRPGTQLRISGLFSTLDNRRKALKTSFLDEKKSIAELMIRFAIHHSKSVTMILKEGQSPDLICLIAPMATKTCLGMFYGVEMEKNSIEFDLEEKKNYQLEAKVVFSFKKTSVITSQSIFILFVNDRLVENVELKREMIAQAQEHLNSKQNVVFFYVALKVPAEDVDVNMHPAKAIVALQNQAEIFSLIVNQLRVELKENLVSKIITCHQPTTPQRTIGELTKSSSSQGSLGQQSSSQKSNSSQLENQHRDEQRLRILAPGSLPATASQLAESIQSSPVSSELKPFQKQQLNLKQQQLASQPQKRQYDLIHNDSTQQTLAQLSGAIKTRPMGRKRVPGETIRPWPGIDNVDSDSSPPTQPPVTRSKLNASSIISGQFSKRDQSVDNMEDSVSIIEIDCSEKASESSSRLEDSRLHQEDQRREIEEIDKLLGEVPRPDSPPLIPPMRPRRELKLGSIVELRRLIAKEHSKVNKEAAKVIKNSIFVGIFDHYHGLIQHDTKLYAINLKNYLKEQFYQFYLYDFGNFPPIKIKPPGNKIASFIDAHLEDIKKYEKDEFDKLKFNKTEDVIKELLKHKEMFEDYLNLKITKDEVITIPCVMPDEAPNCIYLGRFLVDLANEVDFKTETECFKGIGRVIGDFYSEPPANLKDREVHKSYHELIESKLFVAIKNYLLIPEWLFSSDNICQISDTKDLYKVFERC